MIDSQEPWKITDCQNLEHEENGGFQCKFGLGKCGVAGKQYPDGSYVIFTSEWPCRKRPKHFSWGDDDY